MPQMTVYIDDKTLKKIEHSARIEGASVSRWVRDKLSASIESQWPEDYFSLFGALADVRNFKRPKKLSLKRDARRQAL